MIEIINHPSLKNDTMTSLTNNTRFIGNTINTISTNNENIITAINNKNNNQNIITSTNEIINNEINSTKATNLITLNNMLNEALNYTLNQPSASVSTNLPSQQHTMLSSIANLQFTNKDCSGKYQMSSDAVEIVLLDKFQSVKKTVTESGLLSPNENLITQNRGECYWSECNYQNDIEDNFKKHLKEEHPLNVSTITHVELAFEKVNQLSKLLLKEQNRLYNMLQHLNSSYKVSTVNQMDSSENNNTYQSTTTAPLIPAVSSSSLLSSSVSSTLPTLKSSSASSNSVTITNNNNNVFSTIPPPPITDPYLALLLAKVKHVPQLLELLATDASINANKNTNNNSHIPAVHNINKQLYSQYHSPPMQTNNNNTAQHIIDTLFRHTADINISQQMNHQPHNLSFHNLSSIQGLTQHLHNNITNNPLLNSVTAASSLKILNNNSNNNNNDSIIDGNNSLVDSSNIANNNNTILQDFHPTLATHSASLSIDSNSDNMNVTNTTINNNVNVISTSNNITTNRHNKLKTKRSNIQIHNTANINRPEGLSDREYYRRYPVRPGASYVNLIKMAIEESPRHELSLNEIYVWMQTEFAFFRDEKQKWKNAVRHNLSLHKCFQRKQGKLWTFNENEYNLKKSRNRFHYNVPINSSENDCTEAEDYDDHQDNNDSEEYPIKKEMELVDNEEADDYDEDGDGDNINNRKNNNTAVVELRQQYQNQHQQHVSEWNAYLQKTPLLTTPLERVNDLDEWSNKLLQASSATNVGIEHKHPSLSSQQLQYSSTQ